MWSRTRCNLSRGRRLWIANLLLCLAATGLAVAQPPTLKPVNVEVDTSSLPSSEQAALVPLIRAARQIDALYIQQVWPRTLVLLRERKAAPTDTARAEWEALTFFKGPWGPAGTAFLAGVPTDRPEPDFYPSGTAKHDIDVWLATLSEPERKRALDSYTVIKRGPKSAFEIVSYASYYKDSLAETARALQEAASLTHEETLKKYLTLRARALLDDNFYASDVAFVGLEGAIDVALGPYEVDDDTWFGAKTAYEGSISLVDQKATLRTRQVASRLQEIEDHLPLAPQLRGRHLEGAAPILVLNVIYHGGLAGAGGAAAGYGLPNDVRVTEAVGARTGTYSNIIKLRYDSTFVPIADAVLADADRSSLRFEDIRDEIMFVRMFDSLGPQWVTGTRQPIAAALQENAAVAAQIRSMLLSLWGHRYLIDHGYLERRTSASLYSAFLVPALARARGGLASTPSQGSTYVLNHLLEAGAISLAADGRVRIDSTAADADIIRAAMEFISAMAKGDSTEVKLLLQRYVLITPKIRELLARLGPMPELQRPVYRTADRLSPLGLQ